jgi:hypothetical protein
VKLVFVRRLLPIESGASCVCVSLMHAVRRSPAGRWSRDSQPLRTLRPRPPASLLDPGVGWLVGWLVARGTSDPAACAVGSEFQCPPPPFRSFFSTLLARAALHLHRRPEDTHSVLGSSYVLRLPSYSLENRPSYSLGIVVEKWRKPADSVLPRRASGGAWLGREGRPAGRWKGDGN